MSIIPRDYQVESVDETSKAIASGIKRPLMLLPTASGKSVIIALMVSRALKKNPDMRILILCHQGHLLAQNEEKIKSINPRIWTGIYCAGQGRKDRVQDVILASRDSLANYPMICGNFDMIICDEAHMIAVNAHEDHSSRPTQYAKIFKAQKALDKIVIGLTGTGWRMNRGVIWGDGKFFEKVSYNVPMRRLISEGFLCPYVFPKRDVKVIDASKLDVSSTGDYRTSDLEDVSMPEEIIKKCLDIWQEEAQDRKVSIFFTCSRAHGETVADSLAQRIGCEYVCYIDGEMGKSDRDECFRKIKLGHYKAIVNIGVLTTGFDAPIIDCVCWLRATQSVSLFVQMGGRGLRTHEGKKDCLMLDMAGNFERFNSLEEPFGDNGKKGVKINGESEGEGKAPGGVIPTKKCPRCLLENAVAATTCSSCGCLFINHNDKAHKKSSIEFYDIDSHVLIEHVQTKSGKPCHKVYYYVRDGSGVKELKTPQVLLYDMKKWPGPDHRKLYKKLKEAVPIKLQVYNNPKTGWPEYSVIDWVPITTENGECNHRWDMTINPQDGATITFCEICGEIR